MVYNAYTFYYQDDSHSTHTIHWSTVCIYLLLSVELYSLYLRRKPPEYTKDPEEPTLSQYAAYSHPHPPYVGVGDRTRETAVESQCSNNRANLTPKTNLSFYDYE